MIVQLLRDNKEDKGIDLYVGSLIKAFEAEGIKVVVHKAESQYDFDTYTRLKLPTLILEPCQFKLRKPLHYDLEQNNTARVVSHLCKSHKDCGTNVLIINRSELIGRPLANMLLDNDFTVTVAHSKTPKARLEQLIKVNDIIVTATGQRLDIKPRSKVIIDVSNDLPELKGYTGYYGRGLVGRLTTAITVKRAKQFHK